MSWYLKSWQEFKSLAIGWVCFLVRIYGDDAINLYILFSGSKHKTFSWTQRYDDKTTEGNLSN